MNNKSKIKRLTNLALILFLTGMVAISANFAFAQTYIAEYTANLGGTVSAWGWAASAHSQQTTINLPYYGKYDLYVNFHCNGPEIQKHEQLKLFVDEEYIGTTTDCGTDCRRKELLGERNLSAGTHTLRVDHPWNTYDWPGQANSVYSVSAILSLKEIFKPEFSFSKSVDKTQAQPGDILTYTLSYKNTGFASATGITISDDYDEGYVSIYDSGGGSVSSGKISWNIGNLASNVSGSKIFKVKIKTDLTVGTTNIYNKAVIDSKETDPKESDSILTTVTVVNHPPVANAGPDKEVYEGQSVVLNGSGSDPDGDPITYYWTCTGAYLNNQYIAEPAFNAPQVSYAHYYTCTLKVTDDKGLSDSDEMMVLVKDSECNPGQTQTEDCGNCGTKTKICQQNYYWGQWGSCQGEGECCSGDTQTQSCGTGGTGTQTRTCQSGCSWGSWGACQGGNHPPVANAGPDKEVYEGQSVVLNGSGSDPDGDPITYYWTCTGAYLNNQYIAEPAFNAPQVSYAHYYTCTLKVTDDKGLSDSDSMTVRVLNQSVPTADIKANYSDGPITIDYNTSAVLTWTSSNTNSCYASGSWSGTKSTTGTETTGNLVSSRTYSILCSGPGGSASDSVMVNVATIPAASTLIVNKMARNLSRGTNWSNSVSADPGEIVSFLIKIEVTGSSVENLIVKDILPDKIIYQDNLRIDSVLSSGDITSGLNVGSLSPNQIRTITFDARLVGTDQFGFGTTQLSNGASVYTDSVSGSDTVVITVTKKAVAGAATVVSTGLTNNIFLDSFFLPMVITCIIIWFFKSHIIRFEEWLDLRKKKYQEYHAKKVLQLKIAQIRTKEFFRKKVMQKF